MIHRMGPDRTEPATPDLFATDMVRDASPPPTTRVSATEAATDTASKRHVLPRDLPKAVKYLTDKELDLHNGVGRRGEAARPIATDERLAKFNRCVRPEAVVVKAHGAGRSREGLVDTGPGQCRSGGA
jgi:hypothetical protein